MSDHCPVFGAFPIYERERVALSPIREPRLRINLLRLVFKNYDHGFVHLNGYVGRSVSIMVGCFMLSQKPVNKNPLRRKYPTSRLILASGT